MLRGPELGVALPLKTKLEEFCIWREEVVKGCYEL
jgi:hypothetical protein